LLSCSSGSKSLARTAKQAMPPHCQCSGTPPGEAANTKRATRFLHTSLRKPEVDFEPEKALDR